MNLMLDIDLEAIALTLGLVAIVIGLSWWQQLSITKNIAIAVIRAVIQLAIVGYFLDAIFALAQPVVTLFMIGLFSFMVVRESQNRLPRQIKSIMPLLWAVVFLATAAVSLYVLVLIMRADPWHQPRYLVPLASLMLGSATSAGAIAADNFISTVANRRHEIETHLCLGASPTQAIKTYQNKAIKAAMLPALNSMTVAAVVTIPALMVGQLIGGVTPFVAIALQFLVMLAIVAANLLTTLVLTKLMARQLFNRDWQLIMPMPRI
jgi:putative ABC transport system permease protein